MPSGGRSSRPHASLLLPAPPSPSPRAPRPASAPLAASRRHTVSTAHIQANSQPTGARARVSCCRRTKARPSAHTTSVPALRRAMHTHGASAPQQGRRRPNAGRLLCASPLIRGLHAAQGARGGAPWPLFPPRGATCAVGRGSYAPPAPQGAKGRLQAGCCGAQAAASCSARACRLAAPPCHALTGPGTGHAIPHAPPSPARGSDAATLGVRAPTAAGRRRRARTCHPWPFTTPRGSCAGRSGHCPNTRRLSVSRPLIGRRRRRAACARAPLSARAHTASI